MQSDTLPMGADGLWDNTASNTENEQHIIDKYEQMARDMRQAGKEIPAREIKRDAFVASDVPSAKELRESEDFARMMVENSQTIIHKSCKQSFYIPRHLEKRYERIFGHG